MLMSAWYYVIYSGYTQSQTQSLRVYLALVVGPCYNPVSHFLDAGGGWAGHWQSQGDLPGLGTRVAVLVTKGNRLPLTGADGF